MASTKRSKTSDRKKRTKRTSLDSSTFLSRELSEDELELEKFVFGEEPEVLVKHKSVDKTEVSENATEHCQKKPAWHDEDDDNLLVEEKLKHLKRPNEKLSKKKDQRLDKHVKEMFLEKTGTPKWARQTTEESYDKDLLQVTGNFISTSTSLRAGTIDLQKCCSLNHEAQNKNKIKSVEFHPKAQVALVAGFSGTTTIFQVDGEKNAKIQSIHFQDFPINVACFSADGEQIIVGSKEHPHFYYYDMMSGKIVKVPSAKGLNQKNVGQFTLSPDGKIIAVLSKSGVINLVTAKTKEWIGMLKMNGEVQAATFSGDGTRMYTHGETGQVYTWDMNSRQCVNKWNDEGCITGTALALSPNEQYLATGSDTGVVNVYQTSQLASTPNPKPEKALMNLTTKVTSLKFNHSSELLCMASALKDNAVKMVHFPSMSVFANFPLFHQNFRKVNCLDISSHSGYVTLGNNCGNAPLFRLKHYRNY